MKRHETAVDAKIYEEYKKVCKKIKRSPKQQTALLIEEFVKAKK